MFSRESSYAAAPSSSETTDEVVSNLSRRLSGELRQQIRSLTLLEPFSPNWMLQQETVHHIAAFAIAETSAAASGKSVPSMIGVTGGPSLWEKDECCIRFLLEEGKTNLVLRLLVDYAAFASTEDGMRALAQNPQVNEPIGRRYERDLCGLVEVMLRNVEGCQTIDLTLLIEYCAHMIFSVLQPYYQKLYTNNTASTAEQSNQQLAGGKSDHKSVRYEWMARHDDSPMTFSLVFLSRLVSQMDRLDAYEQRILQLFEQYAVLRGCVDLALYDQSVSKVFGNPTLAAIATVISYILSSERYKTHQPAFWGLKPATGSQPHASNDALKHVESLVPKVPGDVMHHIMESFKGLQTALVTRLGTLDAEQKRMWRPLLDACLKAKFYKPKS